MRCCSLPGTIARLRDPPLPGRRRRRKKRSIGVNGVLATLIRRLWSHLQQFNMAEVEAQPAQVDISKTSNVPAEGYDKTCIFCKVVNKEVATELLHCDEEISCFRDIRPGAPHHYLVVPTRHVGNCKSLGKEHVPLVKRMVETGKEILQKNDVTDLSDVRFGFHWPPFCSVAHLHLHVLAPASQMGFISRLVYRMNSYWFITADQLIGFLNSKGETN